jgi:hypothetical protein
MRLPEKRAKFATICTHFGYPGLDRKRFRLARLHMFSKARNSRRLFLECLPEDDLPSPGLPRSCHASGQEKPFWRGVSKL